jgi:uncharacterized protein (TIGR02466 family)
MQMIPIFGAWVGVAQLQSLDIAAALKYVNTLDKTIEQPAGNGAVTVTQRLLDAPVFREVKLECQQLSKAYVSLQGHLVDQVAVTSSWGNTLGRDEPIRVHQHPNSYVSGVFYLTDGAPLNFHNPLQTEDLFTLRPVVQWDAKNQHTWQVLKLPIKPGYLLLFPSKLLHHVEHNDNDFRYSIAFNTMPTGSIGDSTKELNIVKVE